MRCSIIAVDADILRFSGSAARRSSQWPIGYLRSTCKLDTAATAGPSVDQSLKNCVNDENSARQQLVSQWSKFSASKAQCNAFRWRVSRPSARTVRR